ncbi:MAG: hypothetical protein CM15mV142_370 [Caudoviricetes sp.]|nr:MAG: hypothetical protein CM15mV142_370 [Caudoviricetes sp.]
MIIRYPDTIPSVRVDVGDTLIQGQTTICTYRSNQLTIKDSDTSGNGSQRRYLLKIVAIQRFYIGNDESSNSVIVFGFSPLDRIIMFCMLVGGSTKLTAFSGGIGINGD